MGLTLLVTAIIKVGIPILLIIFLVKAIKYLNKKKD